MIDEITSYKLMDDRLVVFSSEQREAIARMLIRFQEFYESPFGEIQGHHFTLKQYKKLYKTHSEKDHFSYYTDWYGFNIPGYAILNWVKVFEERGDISDVEQYVLDHVDHFIKTNDSNFYIVGFYHEGDFEPLYNDIAVHELCHALFHLNSRYRRTCQSLLNTLPKPKLETLLSKVCDKGYAEEVSTDEANAYLATSDCNYIIDNFGYEYVEFLPRFAENFMYHLKQLDNRYEKLSIEDVLSGKYSVRV